MTAQRPTPPIPKDSPLRPLYENERQCVLMRLAELNRALGYEDGNARQRRDARRGWQNEKSGEYKTAS